MHLSRTIAEWQSRRKAIKGTIGFVPTMGALHAGHAALVERCRAENDIVVVSIFVNPTQFNNPDDLAKYPSNLERDLDLLRPLGANEVIFPSAKDLYPNGYTFKVTAPESTAILEGAHRPGHFEGVMTIVLKLLNLVRADRAYFGEKDFQQLRIVKEMAADFFLPTEIVPCPTVREPSGLAMSSRNVRLSAEARERAPTLYRALTTSPTIADARQILEHAGFEVDYIEERWGRRLAAASIEGVRLIDNVAVS